MASAILNPTPRMLRSDAAPYVSITAAARVSGLTAHTVKSLALVGSIRTVALPGQTVRFCREDLVKAGREHNTLPAGVGGDQSPPRNTSSAPAGGDGE